MIGRQNRLFALSLFMTVLVLLACATYLGKHLEDVYRILALKPTFLALAVSMVLARVCVVAWMNRATLWALDVRVSVREALALATVTMVGNLLLPMQGGAAYRAYYLKKTHALAYPKFLAVLVGVQLLLIGTTSVIALGLLVGRYPLGDSVVSDLAMGVSLIAFIGSVCLLGFPHINLPNWRFLVPLRSTSQAGQILLKRPVLIFKIVFASLCMRCCDAACFYLLANGAGLKIGGIDAVTLTSTAAISNCINITPGGVGVYEGIICLLSEQFGLSTGAGLAISLTCRILAIVVVVTLALPALVTLAMSSLSVVQKMSPTNTTSQVCAVQYRENEKCA